MIAFLHLGRASLTSVAPNQHIFALGHGRGDGLGGDHAAFFRITTDERRLLGAQDQSS